MAKLTESPIVLTKKVLRPCACFSTTWRYYVLVLNTNEYREKGPSVAKQETEMLKGILEGVVLTALSNQPTHGYEIVGWLRVRGFSDIAEGTVYALLVRLEQRGLVDVTRVPSEKGPVRKVYSVNHLGQTYLDDFWSTWGDLSKRIENITLERSFT